MIIESFKELRTIRKLKQKVYLYIKTYFRISEVRNFGFRLAMIRRFIKVNYIARSKARANLALTWSQKWPWHGPKMDTS